MEPNTKLNLNLNCFYDFYHVYRCKTPQRAAVLMNKTPAAVNAAVLTFERDLTFPLFERKPGEWVPLPIADELYARLVAPFIEGLAATAQLARMKTGPVLCVAASQFILQEYLGPLLGLLQTQYTGLRVILTVATREEVDAGLAAGKFNLAIVTAANPPPGPFHPMVKVQPVVLVDEASSITDLETLLRHPEPRPQLVAPPLCEGVCQRFSAWLTEHGVYWPVAVQAGATALVPWIMARENSVGLCVAVRALQREGLRAIPLPVAPLTVGALWRGTLTPTLKRMLELLERCAQEYQCLVVNGV